MSQAGHREMTDPENAQVLGTLTHEAWMELNFAEMGARRFGLGTRADVVRRLLGEPAPEGTPPTPGEEIVELARLSSGSISGEARHDLRDVLRGSPTSTSSLTVGVANIPSLPAKTVESPGY